MHSYLIQTPPPPSGLRVLCNEVKRPEPDNFKVIVHVSNLTHDKETLYQKSLQQWSDTCLTYEIEEGEKERFKTVGFLKFQNESETVRPIDEYEAALKEPFYLGQDVVDVTYSNAGLNYDCLEKCRWCSCKPFARLKSQPVQEESETQDELWEEIFKEAQNGLEFVEAMKERFTIKKR